MRIRLMTAIALLAPAFLFAAGWNPQVGLGLTVDKGNNDRNLLVLDFSSFNRAGIHEIRTLASFSNETGSGRRTIRKADFSSKLNLFYHPDLFFFGSLDAVHNSGAGIDYRIAPGIGAGVVIARREVQDTLVYSLTANLGVNPVIENLDGRPPVTRGHYLFIQELEYNFDSRTHLNQRLDYKPSFRNDDNYLLDMSLGLTHEVSRRFNVSNRLKLKYDSNPLPDKKHTDMTLVFSVGYRLGR